MTACLTMLPILRCLGAYGTAEAVTQVGLALRQEGTVLLYGLLAGPTAQISAGDVLFKEKIVAGKHVLCLVLPLST